MLAKWERNGLQNRHEPVRSRRTLPANSGGAMSKRRVFDLVLGIAVVLANVALFFIHPRSATLTTIVNKTEYLMLVNFILCFVVMFERLWLTSAVLLLAAGFWGYLLLSCC